MHLLTKFFNHQNTPNFSKTALLVIFYFDVYIFYINIFIKFITIYNDSK